MRKAYAGRYPEPGATGRIVDRGSTMSAKHPLEEPDEGCPGGWRRCRFAWSLQPYLRLRAEGGVRVPNMVLDSCDDPLVWQLVNLFELEQERCIDYRYKAQDA